MKENVTRVYVRTDEKGNIISVNSSIFLTDTADWVEIDKGEGDRYVHAQGNYFEKPLAIGNGIYRYKLIDGAAAEKTAEEISEEIQAIPAPEPTTEQDLLSMAIDHECRLTLLELGV